MAFRPINPDFAPRVQPLPVPEMVAPPADQTSGIIGGGLKSFGSILDNYRKLTNEIAMDEYKRKLAAAQATKAETENNLEKARQEYYKSGVANPNAPTPPTPISSANPSAARLAEMAAQARPQGSTDINLPENPPPPVPGQDADLGMGMADTDAVEPRLIPTQPQPEQAPQATKQELKKFDAEAEAQLDPQYQQELKDLTAAHYFNPSSQPSSFAGAKKKLIREYTSQKIQAQLTKELSPDDDYETAKAKYNALDPKGIMDRSDVEAVLKNHPTKMQMAKEERDQKRLDMAGAAAERTASAAERTAENSRLERERNTTKDIQTQVKDMGKEIRDGQYVKLASAVKGVDESLTKDFAKMDKPTIQALQGLFARTENVTIQTALANKVLGVNPSDDKTKELLRTLENDPQVKKVISDPKFVKFFANLADLITTDLRKVSGTAVTPAEMQNFLTKFGLSAWNGDAQTLRVGLSKYKSDLGEELNSLKNSYSPEAYQTYIDRGGRFPDLGEGGNAEKAKSLIDKYSK